MNSALETNSPARARVASIEILRIVAMLMIIIGHIIGHNYLLEQMPRTIQYYLLSFLQIVCYAATNIYVLISGYLLCKKSFSLKRVVTLWLQTFLYSTLGFLFGVIALNQFSLSGLLKALLPISGNQYWFARVYFGLYLLMPLLNLLIDHMNQKQHAYSLALLTVLFSFWRSFIPFATTLNSEGGNSIIWFAVLYLYGAYIRKYGLSHCRRPLLIAFLLFVFSFLSRIGLGYLSSLLGFGGNKGTSLFTEFTSFPMLFSAVLIVKYATGRKGHLPSEGVKKVVLWLSASTFGVYLIHENIYIKKALWDAAAVARYTDSPLIILVVLLLAVLIFVICTCLDKLLFFPVKWLLNKEKFTARFQTRLDTALNTKDRCQ